MAEASRRFFSKGGKLFQVLGMIDRYSGASRNPASPKKLDPAFAGRRAG
jgi:hypothetical protein